MKHPLCLLSFAALLTACSPGGPDSASVPREPDPVLIEKLQELVELQERRVKMGQVAREAGLQEFDGKAEIALSEARIALAEEVGDADAIIEERKVIVEHQKVRLERANAYFEDGRMTQMDLDELRAGLLEAEIQLHRSIEGLTDS